MKHKFAKDLPKVYWYSNFVLPKEDETYRDTGIITNNGNHILVSDLDNDSYSVCQKDIYNTYDEVKAAYAKDVKLVHDHAELLEAYRNNYDGNDKLDVLNYSYFNNIGYLKNEITMYQKLWQYHKSGCMNIKGISFRLKDVKSIRYYRRKGKTYGTDKIELILYNDKTINVVDSADIDVIKEIFGEDYSGTYFIME